MKILYLAKHGKIGNTNDDEGAITYALEQLGHEVEVMQERGVPTIDRWPAADFLLFHHWYDLKSIQKIRIPKVFWYFDLVEFPDNTLKRRNHTRASWMRHTIPLIDLGFCTDGDWVTQDKSGKLVRLMQGADSRVTGPGTHPRETPPILFAGTHRTGGTARSSFVQEMSGRYGSDFNVVRRVHGRNLANLIAGTSIVVAPDSPITDNYYSNRIYITLGFEGFILHPYSESLAEHYVTDVEIALYKNREDLYCKIGYYLGQPHQRTQIAHAGYLRTMENHTYKHRCAELIRIVQERLF